jgi:hypothetical protein
VPRAGRRLALPGGRARGELAQLARRARMTTIVLCFALFWTAAFAALQYWIQLAKRSSRARTPEVPFARTPKMPPWRVDLRKIFGDAGIEAWPIEHRGCPVVNCRIKSAHSHVDALVRRIKER